MGCSLGSSQTVQLDLLDKVFTLWLLLKSTLLLVLLGKFSILKLKYIRPILQYRRFEYIHYTPGKMK
jgi:hypothetical protein